MLSPSRMVRIQTVTLPSVNRCNGVGRMLSRVLVVTSPVRNIVEYPNTNVNFQTARDLLYKYFGQLELLELRFPEIRVNFPWRDAFTDKLITQTSIAYEKASVLFQIASTHSAIAASQPRSDPEGVKRAFYYFRTSAGMLSYINENFLHAPSTDLSREVVKFLVDIILAQATEVFFEKCADEKKGNALISKVAAQTAFMYTTLVEDVKDFMGKGIFDRSWVTVIQVNHLTLFSMDTRTPITSHLAD